jgi:hypothetical protein
VITLIWLVSLLCPLPYAYNMSLGTDDRYCAYFCSEQWDSEWKILFSLSTFMMQFIIPFTIMFVCYMMIFIKLDARTKIKLEQYRAQAEHLTNAMTNNDDTMVVIDDQHSSGGVCLNSSF